MRYVKLDGQLMTASRLRALTTPGGHATRVVFMLDDGTELEAIALEMEQKSEVKEGVDKPSATAVMRFVMVAHGRPLAHVGTTTIRPVFPVPLDDTPTLPEVHSKTLRLREGSGH